MRTPYYKLAVKIADRINARAGVCENIATEAAADLFENWFYPTIPEQIEYHQCEAYWMTTWTQSTEQDNWDRITALLFADLISQDKTDAKYKR